MTTTASDYRPKPGSTAHSVCAFFAKNPEEELSTQDVAQKFDVKPASVAMHLTGALTAQLLSRPRPGTYAAGPQLAQWDAADDPTRRTAARRYTPIDIEAVPIVKARPVPTVDTQCGRVSPYLLLWNRMEPGDSVDLPRKRMESFRAWAKRNKVTLTVRQLGVDTYGCWKSAQ